MHLRKIEIILLSIIPLPFCLLTLFLFVYYIRRRYKLYQEIRRISEEQLSMQIYQNYLKNLNIKCIINNFINVILILEFIQNISFSIELLSHWVSFFEKDIRPDFAFLFHIRKFIQTYLDALNLSIIPVLSLLMKFLWLAYRKYEYKFTIYIWSVYILIRAIVIILLINIHPFYGLYLNHLLFGLFYIFDFIQFVYYSRKFYLHLKSRETEIRYFYFDKKAFLESRYLRLHFKVAVILVVLALFFYSFGFGLWQFVLIYDSYNHPNLYMRFSCFVFIPSKILSKILINLNYLYIFIVIVYKSFKNRHRLENINADIKPIIEKYHKELNNTRSSNYAQNC